MKTYYGALFCWDLVIVKTLNIPEMEWSIICPVKWIWCKAATGFKGRRLLLLYVQWLKKAAKWSVRVSIIKYRARYVYMHAKMNQTSQRLHPLDLVSFISMEDGFDGFLISFLIFHNDKVFVGFALWLYVVLSSLSLYVMFCFKLIAAVYSTAASIIFQVNKIEKIKIKQLNFNQRSLNLSFKPTCAVSTVTCQHRRCKKCLILEELLWSTI